jgi:polyhydroxybutyrate depolymerase
VVLLHGAGGTAALALGNTRWDALADREGILLACPEGTRPDPHSPPMFRQNPQTWNDGSGRGHTARAGIDDIGFLGALLDALVREHGTDPARIYLVGFSNGGSLAFRARCRPS